MQKHVKKVNEGMTTNLCRDEVIGYIEHEKNTNNKWWQ